VDLAWPENFGSDLLDWRFTPFGLELLMLHAPKGEGTIEKLIDERL
jgi:hypothetical protein